MGEVDLSIFNLSPMAMWIQDFSAVKKTFQQWLDDGVEDLEQYLLEDPERLQPCLVMIRTIRVNQSTLDMYEASNLNEILHSFANLHSEKISIEKVNFFVSLWNKKTQYICPSVNYTCKGKQIDIQLKASFMPGYEDSWERLLLTTENISDYQNARRFAETLFLHSPTALWVRDYSQIKVIFDQLRQQGVNDLIRHMTKHPEFVKKCFESVKNIGVNQALLDLFKAGNRQLFFDNLWQILRESSQQNFHAQLLALWNDEHQQSRECEYQTVHGDILNIREQLVIFPNSHNNWDTVQIAFTDFSERKKLENHLLHLSKHDQLTQLYNRTFFNDEILKLQSTIFYPVSCVFFDLNGLKEINDIYGHDQGDQILRRFGKILKTSITQTHYSASRLGGDEFVILMPKAKQIHINRLLDKIRYELEVDQIKHPDFPIHVAIGYATTQSNETIEALLKRADEIMYSNKQAFYNSSLKD
ncbi:GGDEF domain-containing protein [Acinetobacter sp. WCHAc060033]|uniref:GGDEF domain-containing protein n=1 Tax=Acinetobacter sp. WCHAc060033 TaxID=2518624 RepID=UPI001023ECAD|nr:GGDEF domain-containing protein [Acinetobacter sp. WCHAc060033]RZG85656.1 GGDEF domain-containing protein [Acinetobacter sp. WCHAc060033]